MSRKVYLTPPMAARFMPLAEFVLGALFIVFGVILATVSEGEARPFAFAFLAIWTAGCLTLIIHAVKTLHLLREGKIEIAEMDDPEAKTEIGFAGKLRDLEALKNEGLISDDEYRRKRAEIIQEKW